MQEPVLERERVNDKRRLLSLAPVPLFVAVVTIASAAQSAGQNRARELLARPA